jgi:hypothetical protein
MLKDCFDCGHKVQEQLDNPKDSESHGIGVWVCSCGAIMRNTLGPADLRSRFKISRDKEAVVRARPRTGRVIQEFKGNHGRMY